MRLTLPQKRLMNLLTAGLDIHVQLCRVPEERLPRFVVVNTRDGRDDVRDFHATTPETVLSLWNMGWLKLEGLTFTPTVMGLRSFNIMEGRRD